MANYTINYACGHGSFEEQLFGALDARERKAEWLGKTKVCPQCYRAKMQAQRQAEQLTAEIVYNIYSQGVWLAVTKGDTYAVKDQLKALGCRYIEHQANSDVLGMRAPKKAWALFIANTPDADNFTATLQAAVDKLATAGVTTLPLDRSALAALSYKVAAGLAQSN